MTTEPIRQFLENDQFASGAGIKLLDVREGYAQASMEIMPQHHNGVGIVQGGAIFTLADLAFAAAVNSHGVVAVAINVSISFVKALSSGILFAEARETSCSRKLATCEVKVTDEKGELVAIFQGMAYRKEERVGGEKKVGN